MQLIVVICIGFIINVQKIKVGDSVQNTKVTSITRYNGVERSYDLLTTDGGYRIGNIPVNSMIEELSELAVALKQVAEAA